VPAKTMRVMFEGRLPFGVTAKDLILALIGHIGAAGGLVTPWNMPQRHSRPPGRRAAYHLHLSIELGAKMGLIAAG